ncbi:GGDEF domain-containing protein [Chitiniphilus eburneus]|uniref:diguanylate cyclase n=1 Tax=Chitiniphilus eburneus TaxID=2571148 RepID=A0A4V5MR17_9NEIS|nr:GGDEF domain-containing protein [Chitiniphilus eburneus]TJZ74018.1 GGDEF domain-containing protein [Chitiniphilus eburneus]
MPTQSNPTEIARETLKQLAMRRMVPTPDHYGEIYHAIAGTPEAERLHPLLPSLEKMLLALPRQTPELRRCMDAMREATREGNWDKVPELLLRAMQQQNGQAHLARGWADLIRELIRQWDARSGGYTLGQKRESLQRVLINFSNNAEDLNEKLDSLVQAWSQSTPDSSFSEALGGPMMGGGADMVPEGSIAWADWRDALAGTLEIGVAGRLTAYPDLAAETLTLANENRAVASEADLQLLLPRLKKFWLRLELANDQEQRLCDGLLSLLRLLADNMGELVVEDDWLRGQIAVLQHIMARPLDMNLIYDAEIGLKEVIYKQSLLKQNLLEAQSALKSMIATFVDRLGFLSDSTSQYHSRISGYAEEIQQAKNLSSLRNVMEHLIQDTRSMQLDVQRSRDELLLARQQADQSEARAKELERELRRISEQVRADQLTGALNRRGLEESFEVEAARIERTGSPLAVALLDLDNFKQLNDVQGHAAGDSALVHLVRVITDMLRPTDIVARYGGEEFVLLLPDTDLDAAVQVLQRLQRELTRRFFLHENRKLLITFSAGVTLAKPGEDRFKVITRADEAMYRAKQAGKNRVEVGA